MTSRVKLFLGAYVNSTNAQNLNCLALAKHLDKSQFDINVLSLYSQPPITIEGVKVLNTYPSYGCNVIMVHVHMMSIRATYPLLCGVESHNKVFECYHN